MAFTLPHAGSWQIGGFRLPDFGITERIAGNTAPRNAQGGSSIINPTPQEFLPSNFQTAEQIVQQRNAGTLRTPGNPGGVLGANTSNTGGGGQAPSQQQQPSYDDQAARMQQEVDQLFSGGYDYLNQLQQSTQGMLPNLLTAAAAPYEAQLPILGQQRSDALSSNQGIQEAERNREQNAIAAARRLFQELTQANTQRFGGAQGNSAGQFVNDTLGKQLMSNIGNIQNTAGENIKGLLTQAQSIESNYQTQVASLTKAIEGAKAQAQSEFQARLDQINNSKFQLEQNKSTAKLDALRELRARINQIEDSNTAYARQLDMMKQQAVAPIQQALQQFGNVANQQVSLATPPTAQYSTVNGGPASTGSQSIMGYLNPVNNRKLSPFDYFGAQA